MSTLSTWQTPTLAQALDAPDAAPYLLASPTPVTTDAPAAPITAPTGQLAPGVQLAPSAPSAPVTPVVTNPLVRCGCGRRTNADMLVDIRALSAATLAAIGLTGHAFICDGCSSRLFRTGTITRIAFYTALGAPAAVLQRLQAST